MRGRWPRELIIGIGIGLIIAASFSVLFDNISDREIERRARDLGMIYRDETLAGTGPGISLLLPAPAAIDAVADILAQGGVLADKQALVSAAATRNITTVAAGVYQFSGRQAADEILTRLTGGESK